MAKKTYAEHAEDALYREVWEDVNNEKTMTFLKKYGNHLIGAAVAIMVVVSGIQMWRHYTAANRIAAATQYEIAIAGGDVNALAAIADNASGATADLALFQSWMSDKNTEKLQKLAADGNTREFRDLAKIHLAGIQGDDMSADDFRKFMSSLDTKSSPFYYDAALLVAQKYLADPSADAAAASNNRATANKFLDKIINDKNAPALITATAQQLR